MLTKRSWVACEKSRAFRPQQSSLKIDSTFPKILTRPMSRAVGRCENAGRGREFCHRCSLDSSWEMGLSSKISGRGKIRDREQAMFCKGVADSGASSANASAERDETRTRTPKGREKRKGNTLDSHLHEYRPRRARAAYIHVVLTERLPSKEMV
ncbi:hypothetical protein F5888DRAFT_1739403 [Russula emetica]|nr:hypothetical protein F5888DRAFT_1739403 [Russula emetica]